jgi:hypothetical protein
MLFLKNKVPVYVKVNFSKETFPTTYSYWPLKPVFLPTPLYIEDASLTAQQPTTNFLLAFQ